ncbi:hypothetical protein DRH14_03265 [Candidatus Shapirobacteria bacterium]|nr:MAG: hypothetical protein DRH14_03265 [Candidatus Shapirobacteria bacterium]
MFHQPVLLSETLNIIQPYSNQTIIDATLGNGGHSLAFLEQGATVYGIDADPHNLEIAQQRIKEANLSTKFHPILDNFSNLKDIYQQKIKTKIDCLFFDLGLSRNQQKAQNRGFSFNDTQSLDMRLNPQQQLTAEEIINTYSFEQLHQIFTKIGQQPSSRPLIHYLIKQRQKKPIHNSAQLAQIISDFYQKKQIKSKIHPATKILMSLRIVVNQEFQNLKLALQTSLNILNPQSKVIIISFHSGEDRIVKLFIKNKNRKGLITPINKKAISANNQEITSNPLSRSAKLRAFIIN